MSGLLEEGIQAYKEGDKASARRYFVQAIKSEPQNEKAWLYLTQVANSAAEREKCLRQVLKINPSNRKAAQALEKLVGTSVTIPAPAPMLSDHMPAPPKAQVAAETIQPSSEIGYETEKEKQGDWIDRFLPVFMIIGAVLFVCVLLGMMGSSFSSSDVAEGEEDNGRSGFSLFGGSHTPVSALSAKEREAIFSGLQSNISAHNAENIEWYMNTIHPDSPMRNKTEKELEKIYPLFDLQTSLSDLEILSVTATEARVQFKLTTIKIDGPSFRDNTISGMFVMRLDNTTWKIYDQSISRVDYVD